MRTPPRAPTDPRPVADDGEMGARIRAFDWSQTSVGPAEAWPPSLKTAIGIMLGSRYPMFIWWGPELTNFYNDGYIPVLGKRHPAALGRRAAELWAEIWDTVGVQAAIVMHEGRATWNEELLLLMERHGYTEETYFTFSYSPVPDDEGGVGGVFCACTEDTGSVLGARRLKTLRDLGGRSLAEARTVEQVGRAAAATLAENPQDFSFALLYLLDEAGRQAHLCEAIHLAAETSASPAAVESAGASDVWDFHRVLADGRSRTIDDLGERFGRLPAGAWADDWTRRALVLPLAKAGVQDLPAGFLVAGLSPRLEFSDDYRGFLELAAGQIATAIANVRAYEEERRRAEALAEIDRAKTTFFSNVSHELRTPLTLMLGPLEDVLAHPDRLMPAERGRLEVAHRNAVRLLKLVNTLLDFSRIEAGRMQAAYEPLDLAAFTADLASVFRSAIERAGLRLIVDCPPLAEPVWVDPTMWEKIVSNLLSNAFKFTFEGEIEVRLRGDGERAVLTVRDTGTGIPTAELPHLFERFHRVEGARGRSFEGTGIGLSFVQELVKLHGGTVGIESEVDRGTTLFVTLPVGKAHLPADRLETARPIAPSAPDAPPGWAAAEEARRWLPGAEAELPPEEVAAAGTPPMASGDRPRILVADDNADMRDYVGRLLGREYEVVAVADGAAALRAVREQPFDLVLSDVMMPHLDGFGLLAALRADERTRTLPVLLLSARAGEEAQVEGLKAGADDYLTKPFSARELLARVAARLEVTRIRREADAATRESEGRFHNMADNAPVMIWVTEADGTCTYLNRSWYDFTGQTPETGLGFGWLDATHPDDRAAAERSFLAANESRSPFRIDYRLRRHDGVYRWMIDSARPRFSADGTFRGYIGSVLDITERQETEDALKAADRRKDEFLAMLAHELRNPLAPIRNAVQVLRMIGPADAHQQWAREVIERQTQHLTRLVDDLLDVSRITRGKITLASERLDLAAIVQRAVESSRPLIDARRHELVVDLPPERLEIEGDLTRLVQVVGNLLNNAAKYTDEGGRIAVAAAREDGEVVLRVRDNGMGLPAELLPHVFDLFTQADRSLDRSQGGLGIGLTLVRQLVELHGGRVEAHSDGFGQGSEFVVRLPAAAPEVVPGSAGEVGGEARSAGRGLRILVVEDNEDSAEMLSFLLRLSGHEVRMAHDGPAALEAALAFQPQVVLCDIGLPGMNGYQVAERLRAQPAFARIPLIALSGYGQEEARQRSKGAGYDHHLVKPLEPAALEALLESLRAAGAGE